MGSAGTADQALLDADAALERFDLDAVVAHLSTAVRILSEGDDPRRAAMACVRLGDTYGTALGNLTAARAWFARAWRLVEHEPPCVEQGWVAVAAMGCDVDDPAVLLAAADLALDRARTFGDVNLETKALADAGLARVRGGRIDEGMALLDEAMALACGPADDAEVAAKSVCSFFTACYHVGAVERAGEWTDLLRRQGLLGPEPGPPIFLSSHCDRLQASLLVELGRWTEAEEILTRATAAFEEAMPAPAWHPLLGLAELRVRQGRPDEAERLLLGLDQTVDALLPMARVHLDRGDLDLARRAAQRGLRMVGDDRLQSVDLLAILIDVELADRDVAAAARRAEELAARIDGLDVPALRTRAAAARAGVLAASGATGDAIVLLEQAIDALAGQRLPWLELCLLLRLAALRESVGSLDAARADAAAARRLLTRLDVVPRPLDLALLERLAPEGGPPPTSAVLAPTDRGWSVSWRGTTVLLPASKGLTYLSVLLAAPGVERHALDLVDRAEGGGGEVDRRRLGDAGEVIDSAARRAYRLRIEVLRSEIDDAVAGGELGRAEDLHVELEALVAQLAAAFGLGGQPRRVSSAAERARLNVTRALRSAIARIGTSLPEPAAVLDRGVRTGLYCAFAPEDGDGVRWSVAGSADRSFSRE